MRRYTRQQQERSIEGRQYYKRVVYPTIPRSDQDLYVFTTEEDRYDLLALQFYKAAELWWVIARANPKYSGASLHPGSGVQIRIPYPIQDIINEYNALNE